jgi:outer membrane protein assembly factor BamB
MFSLDAASGDVRWKSDEPTGTINSRPTIGGGILYVGDRVGFLHAFDADSGEHLWKFETGNAVYSSPLVTDDTIYFGSNDGYVYAIER